MKTQTTSLGVEIQLPHHLILFGGKDASFANIKNHYAQYNFTRIKQTHGDVVIESLNTDKDYQIEADAHFTRQPDLGLCISTADCVPCLLFDLKGEYIAGIHAGWRGVVQRIIPKTIQTLQGSGAMPENIYALIGPHIQKPSFQVGNDVRDQLLSSIQIKSSERAKYFTEDGSDKALVDLHKIVHQQLKENGILPEHVHDLQINTVTDTKFHSHRRDRENAGRQLSFILRHV